MPGVAEAAAMSEADVRFLASDELLGRDTPSPGLDSAAAYIARTGLPRHPLVSRGFRSIGCAPCTTAVAPGEDQRAGRWRGTDRVACDIHAGNRR